ncbi:hypothetical protein EDD29_0129 [Actinocorallia herbida]|uniref:Uncharacterized protein n=1 Tax=Actinocorallia herbida TaxID=58109 RepID=A0A3N1CPJ3_9ACTN|nr:hypothetical protein [Actinocorallia herbida]ROO82648.1 hypothetical protein EDD29_0129 [Actinocorallia herbida]
MNAPSTDKCPRCKNEPIAVRGLGQSCYDRWKRLDRRGDPRAEALTPPLTRKASTPEKAAKMRAARSAKAAERRAAYCELRRVGHSKWVASHVLGVTKASMYKNYEPAYQATLKARAA